MCTLESKRLKLNFKVFLNTYYIMQNNPANNFGCLGELTNYWFNRWGHKGVFFFSFSLNTPFIHIFESLKLLVSSRWRFFFRSFVLHKQAVILLITPIYMISDKKAVTFRSLNCHQVFKKFRCTQFHCFHQNSKAGFETSDRRSPGRCCHRNASSDIQLLPIEILGWHKTSSLRYLSE